MKEAHSSSTEGPESIVAIDIGPENMGFGQLWLNHPDNPEPYLERSSLRMTPEGDYYKQYEEGLCVELIERFVKAHWSFIREASIVLIEKQMARGGSNRERACLMIEMCLCMCLRRERTAPPYVVITPVSWKRAGGIELTGSHSSNKSESIAKFKAAIGETRFQRYAREQSKLDDIADVFHMLQYGKKEFTKLMKLATTRRNHTSNIFDETNKPRVYHNERVGGYIDFEEGVEQLERLKAENKYADPLQRHKTIVAKRLREEGDAAMKPRKARRTDTQRTIPAKGPQWTPFFNDQT